MRLLTLLERKVLSRWGPCVPISLDRPYLTPQVDSKDVEPIHGSERRANPNFRPTLPLRFIISALSAIGIGSWSDILRFNNGHGAYGLLHLWNYVFWLLGRLL